MNLQNYKASADERQYIGEYNLLRIIETWSDEKIIQFIKTIYSFQFVNDDPIKGLVSETTDIIRTIKNGKLDSLKIQMLYESFNWTVFGLTFNDEDKPSVDVLKNTVISTLLTMIESNNE